MIYRNLLNASDKEIQLVIDEAGSEFLDKLHKNLEINQEKVTLHTLYVLSSIGSGNSKQKKMVLEYFNQALKILQTTSSKDLKIAVLNLILNLIFKESDATSETRVRKQIVEMEINKMLIEMREKEKEHEVKTNIDRVLKKLNE